MTTARLRIDRASPHVTVQDAGRPGLMRFGVTRSGPMDPLAFAAANLSLGNPPDAPGLEIPVSGLALTCLAGALRIAVTGGGFGVAVNGHAVPAWCTATLEAGTSLQIRPGLWGSWAYLALAGQLRADRWLGSASTHGPLGLGGGRLRQGDILMVDDPRAGESITCPITCPVFARPRRDYRVVIGPQDRFFDAATIAQLSQQSFRLSDAYDRMGVRLSGPLLKPTADLSMPSEGIVRGSIQVSGDGLATVLLVDHQTTGGYPKIATMISPDVDRFVQLRSRATIRFSVVSAVEAIGLTRTARQAQARYLDGLRRSD